MVGGGIVGLAVARQLRTERPDIDVVVLEKEPRLGAHQTSHNSGVIHAGIYYTPGSVKARLCRRGVGLMKAFCDEHDITYRNLGKLVVATNEVEAARLDDIHGRAMANGITDVKMIDRVDIAGIEPHVVGVKALYSPSTAVVDYGQVALAYADDLRTLGAEIRTGAAVTGLDRRSTELVVHTSAGAVTADHVVVCAGLHSSRLAELLGGDDDPRIIPFRGEYHRLAAHRTDLVRGLVYPVPDPRYPFLGIHLTRHVDDTVGVGPNAVLALALEGYRRRDVSARDLATILRWPGFLRMARQHWRTGIHEMRGSFSKQYFAEQARRYVPELAAADLEPAHAGVRAQAVRRDGSLVDDFWITTADRVTSVRNAPSPAATSSLAIAEHVCAELLAAVS